MQKTLLLLIAAMIACFSDSYSQSSGNLEKKIDSLLSTMTLTEKIGQTSLRGTSSRVKTLPEELKQAVREGRIGSVINVLDRNNIDELQRIAVKESPHGIPLLVGRDVIHGYKTIFPIPLAQAATWNPDIVERGAGIAAEEASTNGIRWTFAPMLDISRDPRWGRIAESEGEDPYLTSVLGRAYVKGFQGDMSSPNKIASCVKHFAGYGAAEGGRDYNSVMLSENVLRDIYLKPFKAAVDAGAATVMASFNDLNGVPASGNKFLLQTILRDEWKFKGFVVSDWNGVTEMITHGYCADAKDAAYRSATASLDMEMTSTAYENNLAGLIKEGKVSEAQLDDMVRNILRVKFKLGLFKSPYVDRSRDNKVLSDEHRAAAKEAAMESMVLLKNNSDLLPLAKDKRRFMLVGPLANAPHEQMGTWIFDGKDGDAVTPYTSLQKELGNNLSFAPTLAYSRDKSTVNFNETIASAKKADVILFFGGEESILSGEAHSRADLNLPGAQEQLIKELKKTGKPIVLVIFAGRPITLTNILNDVDAIVMGWHPGTMAGPAISDILFGMTSPSGRLPITWPKSSGQLPIYYNHFNTGRPATSKSFVQLDSIPVGAWQSSLGNTSHYLDLGFVPQYPFGYGLQYTTFSYSDLKLSNTTMPMNGAITIRTTVTNTGKRAGTEVVQLYVQDVVGDVVRPVKELKGFQRITLSPGQKQEVIFTLTTAELSFHNQAAKEVTEPGKFNVWIGKNASDGTPASFVLE